ncbi:16S rRNA (uracil(1498)-N(3))-methyltransferase [Marinobacter zhanjiangensis]|uniref:Ribosomal RNA small subunit methyltransferase E n=1 Tax=Marinobacter zhanjiangensis TaxID=578215 RepID=A0ABQ3B7A8_9GAMM|nr:16S rRNA (uracil(1498)-N(3))-methyltransferase [Marinobacter zhanjiangensis]GGY78891.1 ribosomal RNA small subunit methyltransferase E [Marinobacter zhanjiangensis]
MRNPRIYTDAPLQEGHTVFLDDSSAHHVGKVLRMQTGQPLELFNGDGANYPAELDEVGKKRVSARILSREESTCEPCLKILLGQVISKGDRMDYAVQKSTELGVDTIVPLTSERCDVRLKGDREDKRIRHWQQVAISAAEQCGRATVPTIAPLTSLADWFSLSAACDLRLVLHHRTDQPLSTMTPPEKGVALLVGPEGGLSEAEIAAARESGFSPAAMGPRVLRTETAPVAAITLCQWLWGDFSGADQAPGR